MPERCFVLGEITSTATLVGIQGEEQATLFVINDSLRKGATLTGMITRGFFDFDYLSTQISHQLRGIGRRHQVAEFQYMHSFQSLHTYSSYAQWALWSGAVSVEITIQERST